MDSVEGMADACCRPMWCKARQNCPREETGSHHASDVDRRHGIQSRLKDNEYQLFREEGAPERTQRGKCRQKP